MIVGVKSEPDLSLFYHGIRGVSLPLGTNNPVRALLGLGLVETEVNAPIVMLKEGFLAKRRKALVYAHPAERRLSGR
ncbi:hypothetical protein VNO77_49350 [Canavalia gladiata]|uniref:Uncharacterized protein n=1 Tax=Canavalia gladiata TaxID=3824 RepID=A0AAN9JDR0_CANGL